MWKLVPCQKGTLGEPSCLGWEIATVEKSGKTNLLKKDGDFKKKGKTSSFQGRKVHERLPNIKKETLVNEGTISILNWRI